MKNLKRDILELITGSPVTDQEFIKELARAVGNAPRGLDHDLAWAMGVCGEHDPDDIVEHANPETIWEKRADDLIDHAAGFSREYRREIIRRLFPEGFNR